MSNKVFDRSIFAPYFAPDDAEALAWAENVLEKLLGKELAKSVLQQNENGTDTDVAELYRPVCIFLSYFVRLAREFRDFKDNDFLSNQYLNNRGHFTSGNESLAQLQYVISNLLRIRAQRGTIKMVEPSVDPGVPDGELLRLVAWNPLLFFKMGVARPQHNSWNLNNSGPLFRGNTGRYDLNIGYEYTEDALSLDSYPIINENYVFLRRYRGKDCIEIEEVPFGQVAGIGASDLDKDIVIDPRLNYEITFLVAQDITLENITFGVKAFDVDGDPVDLLSAVTGQKRNFFFETRRLNKAGKFYMIRGIIYNKDFDLISADQGRLDIGFGQQLKSTDNVVSIIPYIVMDNNLSDDSDHESDNFDSDSVNNDSGAYGTDESGSGFWSDSAYDGDASLFIWNLKVTPCNTNYNRCYLNNKNFIDLYVINKNGRYTNDQIRNIARKHFIPYNTPFKITNIGEISEVNTIPPTNYLLLEDGGYWLLENENRILLEVQNQNG